jgi:hypothetical protein
MSPRQGLVTTSSIVYLRTCINDCTFGIRRPKEMGERRLDYEDVKFREFASIFVCLQKVGPPYFFLTNQKPVGTRDRRQGPFRGFVSTLS